MDIEQKVATSNETYPCLICYKPLSTKVEFFRHLFGHREKILHCKLCDGVFTYVGLQEHLMKNHKFVSCRICDKEIHSKEEDKNLKSLQTFTQNPRSEQFTVCHCCDQRFPVQHLSERFEDDSSVFRGIQCSEDLEIVYEEKYKKFTIVRDNLKVPIYRCNLCSLNFKMLKLLDQHLDEKHGDLDAYLCTACNLSFDKLSHLKDHNRLVHS